MSMGAFASDSLQGSAWVGAMIGGAFGLLMVLVDRLLKGVSLRAFSSASVGLGLGFIVSYLFQASGIMRYQSEEIQYTAGLILYAIFGYIGMMLAIRSNRDEFSLIIPYVRFSRQSVQDSPMLLDTNILIDGRLKAVVETGFLSTAFIVPSFVLEELQNMADSKDWQLREKGRRGLDYLADLRKTETLEITIYDAASEQHGSVDQRLIMAATMLQARLLTNDGPLCKVARLKGVPAINLNELNAALDFQAQTGDRVQVPLIKQGKDADQAVGYLQNGSMIVVNQAAHLIGNNVDVTIISTVATGSGRLFFAELVKDAA